MIMNEDDEYIALHEFCICSIWWWCAFYSLPKLEANYGGDAAAVLADFHVHFVAVCAVVPF